MTNKNIEARIRSILKEMNSWHVPKVICRVMKWRRDLILCSQGILYAIETARKKETKLRRSEQER